MNLEMGLCVAGWISIVLDILALLLVGYAITIKRYIVRPLHIPKPENLSYPSDFS